MEQGRCADLPSHWGNHKDGVKRGTGSNEAPLGGDEGAQDMKAGCVGSAGSISTPTRLRQVISAQSVPAHAFSFPIIRRASQPFRGKSLRAS